jgi:S1-C subfamily serine protease
MRLIAAIPALLLATAAWAAGPEDGPDGTMLVQAAKSVVQVISTSCTGEEGDRSGSGFALDKDGLFVTDLHVVAGCTGYQVRDPDVGEWPATLVHVLKARDLALLKVNPPPGIPPLQLSEAAAQFNEKLQVVGYPLGLSTFESAPLDVTLATSPSCSLHSMTRLARN